MSAMGYKPRGVPKNTARSICRLGWSEQADVNLIRMRRDGLSLRSMATAFGLSRSTVAGRLVKLGISTPTKPPIDQSRIRVATDLLSDPDRMSLPAGHPITWSLITYGTSLEGVPYESPSPIRRHRAAERETPIMPNPHLTNIYIGA